MAGICVHSEWWLARDGAWRCERCDPPLPGEVLRRIVGEEQLRLEELDDLKAERERERAA